MRVVVSEFISLDGVVEAPDQWHVQFFTREMGRYKFDELFASDALLLGRVTYQGFAEAWPSRSDAAVVADVVAGGGAIETSEMDGFASRMNSLPKYVASTTLKQVEWNNSKLMQGDIVAEVSQLKQQPGQDILVVGSIGLCQTLMKHNLIDEYRLMIHPVVVGRGKPLFQNESFMKVLNLAGTQVFGSGVIVLTYHPSANT